MLSQSQRWLPNFRAQGFAWGDQGPRSEGKHSTSHCIGVKKNLLYRQHPVSLKYLDPEKPCVVTECDPQYFLIPRQGIFLLHCCFSVLLLFLTRETFPSQVNPIWIRVKSQGTPLPLEKRNIIAKYMFCIFSLKKVILWVWNHQVQSCFVIAVLFCFCL